MCDTEVLQNGDSIWEQNTTLIASEWPNNIPILYGLFCKQHLQKYTKYYI
jgi:hypothetical protein